MIHGCSTFHVTDIGNIVEKRAQPVQSLAVYALILWDCVLWGYGMGQKEFLRGDSSWIALTILSRLFGFPISEYFTECTDQSMHTRYTSIYAFPENIKI